MTAEHLIGNYQRSELRLVAGQGVWLEDETGRRYLDALSGIAVNALGHSHPALTAAIAKQAGVLIHTSNLFHNPLQEALAEQICAHSFGEQVYFCNSGAEANEACYKLARLWGNVQHGGRKTRLIAAEGGFHGRTIGALCLTANPAYREPFAPLPEVTFVPYGDVEALAAVIDDDCAALWLEPLQGEGGVRLPPPGYLARARELCDAHGCLLVFDEVQVGCGRLGHLFGYQREGVQPDAMALAKGLGGGVPIGAMVTTRELGALMKPGTHATTFGGNYLACAAGCAVFAELTRPGFLEQVRERGEQLQAGLRQLFAGRCREVRGCGLLQGVALDTAPGPLAAAARAEGLIVGTAGDQVLRLAPPLVISAEEVEELLRRLAKALNHG
ncbi:MAG: acetylornithine transaminase [Planctomycetota bacterium]|nr:MAG: acetylornithine transaminase [Planctomycetota bacterium]